MAASRLIETLLLLLAGLIAIRRSRPASPPYASRAAWIALMLAVQLGLLYGFVRLQSVLGWGVQAAWPPGLVFLTQLLRALVLVAAATAWVGIIAPELTRTWRRVLFGAAVLAMTLGGGPLQGVGLVSLLVMLGPMKWTDGFTGGARGMGFVVSALLLAGVSFLPWVSVFDGHSVVRFAMAPGYADASLLSGMTASAASAELALTRPLDQLVKALLDVFRLQLVVVTVKLLLAPIKLSGMSLKRRFTINFMLVRSVPAFLSAVILMAFGYLVLGHLKLQDVRGEFERTLARAGTVASAVGERVAKHGATDSDPELERMARWMGDDGARAFIVMRDAAGVSATGQGTPPPLLDAGLAGADSGDARGVVVAGDSLYLAARHVASPARTVVVYVPLDSLYLARITHSLDADLRISALPHVFVGTSGLRVSEHESWTPRTIRVRSTDVRSGTRRRGFLAREYVPVGDWTRTPRGTERGGIELYLETSMLGLIRGGIRWLTGLYSSIPTLLLVIVVGFVITMIERFAVRSGRSIIDAVLDEMTTLHNAAERFGAGDLDFRLPVQGKDEFSVVAASFNDMATSLERQRLELVTKGRLEQELAVARDIQQRFLPQTAPSLEGLDVAGVSIPSREVGGDLFYWFAHPDGSLGFTLGDVSGKSVPAALLMSNVLAALRVQAIDRIEISDSLGRVNRLIVDQIEPGQFVTLFFGEVDARAGTLRYTSAGHNPPLLLCANGRTEWLRDGGLPLGVDAKASYTTSSVPFAVGDVLIVYSDGVTEAERQAPSGAPASATSAASPAAGPTSPSSPALFGEEGLTAVAGRTRGESSRAIVDAVVDSVHAFASGTPQADDITIIVVRRV